MKHQYLNQTKNAIASSNRESALAQLTKGIARSSTHPIEELQGAIGNQAVNQLLANQPIVQAKPMFRGLSQEFRSNLTQIDRPIQAKEVDSASVKETHAENKTGLPDNLKVGIENLSGIAMDDVRVHYNSSKPSELQALAYTQGTDIHIAPGQEQHLPHEAWHVVQQMQGRVKPTLQVKGKQINDDDRLEQEADAMGSTATHSVVPRAMPAVPTRTQLAGSYPSIGTNATTQSSIQRYTKRADLHEDVEVSDEAAIENRVNEWGKKQGFTEDTPLEDVKTAAAKALLDEDRKEEPWCQTNGKRALVKAKTQYLWATNDLIEESNTALATVGKQGSFIRLHKNKDRTFQEQTEDSSEVTYYQVNPVWEHEKYVRRHYHQDAEQASKAEFKMWADCGKASQAVTGSNDSTMCDRRVVYGSDKQEGKMTLFLGITNHDDKGTQFANVVYIEGMKQFLDNRIKLGNFIGLQRGVHYFSGQVGSQTEYRALAPKDKGFTTFQKQHMLPEGQKLSGNIAKFTRWQYSQLIGNALQNFDSSMEINQFANPQVGESYLMNTEKNMPGYKGIPKAKTWNYHWGGVIMKDGSDNITLEGFSVSNQNQANDQWIFDIYGTDNTARTNRETFHQKHKATKLHGTKATSMVVKTVK
jgi:Domain of unknown function (DUF4157)